MNNTRNKTMKAAAGFTLIEVLVVVVILGILAAIIVPNIMSKPGEARIAKAKTDIRTIEQALSMYKLDNGSYPTTDQGLQALVQKPSGATNYREGGYLPRLPKDPWGRQYQYLDPGVHGAIDIYTLGRDGQQGGKGEDADVGNWNLDQ
ncbi:MAG TPA: type II secretion system major pseudopilin GspG [Gammaproteobacteria bacterium]|nr:type II secretion system major pseudopilin GspG [Gammaproteobacteria bacterium]